MESEQAVNLEPGWYKDPYFRDHERYWDGKWTDQLRPLQPEQPSSTIQTNGVAAAVAEPLSTARPVTAFSTPHHADAAVGSASEAHDDDTLMVAAATAVATSPRADDTATIPATRPADLDTGVLPAVAKNGAAKDLPPRSPQWEASRAAKEEAAAARGRERRRKLAYAAGIVTLVVIAVVSLILVSGKSGTTNPTTVVTAPPASAAQAGAPQANSATATSSVQAAATASVAKKSVVATVNLVPADSSQSVPLPIAGAGAFVLNVGLGPLTVTGSGGSTKTQKLLFQGTTVYVNVSDSPVPGKTWVVAGVNNMPALGSGAELTSLIATMGNPGLLLQQLATTPISVSESGTSTVGNTTVHVYDVSFTSGATTTLAAGYGSHSSEQVDVDPNGKVRQIVMPGPAATVNGQGVSQNVVVTFTHYGKPLVVTTPPFGELISLSQYLTRPAPASGETSGNS